MSSKRTEFLGILNSKNALIFIVNMQKTDMQKHIRLKINIIESRAPLFHSERVHRLQPCRLIGGIHPEHQPDKE